MKNLITTIIVFLGFVPLSVAQPCFEDGLILRFQYEIDSLQIWFPDCTEIVGFLKIEDYTGNVENLDGLNHLTSVGGDLILHRNQVLADIDGLSNLISVGGDLIIEENIVLPDINGLGNITSIGGDLLIRYSPALTSLSGLENVDAESINNLNISHNYSLSDCQVQSLCDYLLDPNGEVNIYYNATGCDSPGEIASRCGNTMPCLPFGNYIIDHQSEIDSFFSYYPDCFDLKGNVFIQRDDITSLEPLLGISSIDGDFFISSVTELNSLSGLDHIETVGGNMRINHTYVTTFEGLNELKSIGEDFFISYNLGLLNFSGFDSLTTIGGVLEIEKNSYLANLDALKTLHTVGGLRIKENSGLKSISGLKNISHVEDVFYINNNDSLSDVSIFDNLSYVGGFFGIGPLNAMETIEGFEDLTTVGGGFFLIGNDNLQAIEGFDNLDSIGGNFTLEWNGILNEIPGLTNLKSIGGYIRVNHNSLISIEGLEQLNSVGGFVEIEFEHFLQDFSGFSSLSSIGGYLSIMSLNSLTSLSGLENLTSIGGELKILCNDKLASIDGIANIDAETISGLSIFGNTPLSICEVQSVCDYLSSPNGEVNIGNNATGCENREIVEEKCLVKIDYTSFSDQIKLYPNPFSTSITIEYQLDQASEVTLIFFNHVGKQVDLIQQKQSSGKQQITWKPQGLSPGMYYFTLRAGDQVSTGKMVLVR